MYGARPSGKDGNGSNKKDDDKKNNHNDKLINDTLSKRNNLIRQLLNLVLDLEGLVTTLSNYLHLANITFVINSDGSSSLDVPINISDDDLDVARLRIDNLDLSIRSRHDEIQNILGQIDGVNNILNINNVLLSDDQTVNNLTARILVAMGHFFSIVREEL